MQLTVNDGRLSLSLHDLLLELDHEQRAEVAKVLACQADMLDVVVQSLITGTCDGVVWIDRWELEAQRIKLLDALHVCCGSARTFLREQVAYLKADIAAERQWGYALLRLLHDRIEPQHRGCIPAVPARRPTKVITLSGSSRFIDIMAVAAWELEKLGYITLSCHLLPQWYTPPKGDLQPDHQAEAEGVEKVLDAVHLRKIDMSDELMVIDWGGYIGESTHQEMSHAETRGVPITLFSADERMRPVREMIEREGREREAIAKVIMEGVMPTEEVRRAIAGDAQVLEPAQHGYVEGLVCMSCQSQHLIVIGWKLKCDVCGAEFHTKN